MMGIGIASGDDRAVEAAQQATNSSLLEASIAGATRVLFSIAGGPELTLDEVEKAAAIVEACADENANIIYGQIIDERMGDTVRITVIATGFKAGNSQSTMDFGRNDLFASTGGSYVPPASANTNSYSAPQSGSFSAPQASSYAATSSYSSAPSNRFADEDFIPDFLRRQR